MSDHNLLLLNTWLLAMVGIALLLVVVLKFRLYTQVLTSQARIEAEGKLQGELLASVKEWMGLVKEWTFIGASRHKDAAANLERAVQVDALQPTRAEIAEKLDAAPDLIAERVAERIKSGDSGERHAPGKSSGEIPCP